MVTFEKKGFLGMAGEKRFALPVTICPLSPNPTISNGRSLSCVVIILLKTYQISQKQHTQDIKQAYGTEVQVK